VSISHHFVYYAFETISLITWFIPTCTIFYDCESVSFKIETELSSGVKFFLSQLVLSKLN